MTSLRLNIQVDIATVDIIERASQADPDGKRTVGVLTKPDMIGDGAHRPVIDTLLNITKPLRLGYVMVKVRFICMLLCIKAFMWGAHFT